MDIIFSRVNCIEISDLSVVTKLLGSDSKFYVGKKYFTKNPTEISNEIYFLKKCKNLNFVPNFVKCTPMYQIIMQHIPFPELLNLPNMIMNERLCRKWFRNLCENVFKLHSIDISHCDLKPENILINKNTFEVFIVDFGCAQDILRDIDGYELTVSSCGGTLGYAPPEIFQKNKIVYPSKVDVWSLGMCLYVCLRNCFPMPSESPKIEQWMKGYTSISSIQVDMFSKDLQNLFHQMFDPNPKTRYTVLNILESNWIQTNV